MHYLETLLISVYHKKLIEEGLNVNQSRSGLTPLMAAASAGQVEAGRVILEAGVNINEKNDDGWTALHKAAYDQAATPVVELLLEFGINADEKDRAGKTALMLAEEKKHHDIARVINRLREKRKAGESTAIQKKNEPKPIDAGLAPTADIVPIRKRISSSCRTPRCAGRERIRLQRHFSVSSSSVEDCACQDRPFRHDKRYSLGCFLL